MYAALELDVLRLLVRCIFRFLNTLRTHNPIIHERITWPIAQLARSYRICTHALVYTPRIRLILFEDNIEDCAVLCMSICTRKRS